MPIEVHNHLAFDTKVLRAGNAALGLWVRAAAWSTDQNTDGFVPTRAAATLGTRGQAQRLVDADLWATAPGGFRFLGEMYRLCRSGWTRHPLAPDLRQMVIARDGHVCGLCGGDVAHGDVHIDHILPVSKGGTDLLSNLQVTHSACNLRKGGRV